VLKADGAPGQAPLVNIFGGKITTYRRLAESMLEKIEGLIGAKGQPWTAGATLPGGDFKAADFDALAGDLARAHGLEAAAARRLARLYGTRAKAIAGRAASPAEFGRDFGHGLTEAEVDYLVREEWAVTADDILWRRSKLGLHFSKAEAEALAAHMDTHRAAPQRKAAGR
jgi:glycerol-3-phosphate dehydrogenase